MADKTSFNALKKLSINNRLKVANSPAGEAMLSLLTPTDFALMFPKYYQKALPDVGGFRAAVSRSTQQQQERLSQAVADQLGIDRETGRRKGGWLEKMGEKVSNPVMVKEMYSYLMSKPGMDHAHAIGIINNIRHESNFNSGVLGDGGTSGGLFQHHASRFSAMKSFVGEDWQTNWKKQIDFAMTEGEMKQYMSTKFGDEKAASMGFTRQFEKPAQTDTKAFERAETATSYSDFVKSKSSEDSTATVSGFTQEEQQKRTQVRQGRITFEGDESASFHYGSGSPSDPNYPSMPFGSSEVTSLHPHNVPGGVGYDLPSLQGYDPKVNRQRDGMVIHMGRTNDPQKLYSHGCLAIPPDEFPEFQNRLEQFRQKNGSAYINVFPDGHISITSKPSFEGKDGILTADAAVEKQKESIVNNEKPKFDNPVSQKLQTEFNQGEKSPLSYDEIVTNREKNASDKPETVAPTKKESTGETAAVEKPEKKSEGPQSFDLNRSALIGSIRQTDDFKSQAGIFASAVPDDTILNGFFADARTKKIMKDTGTTYDPTTGKITSKNPDMLLKSFGDMDTSNILTPSTGKRAEAETKQQTASVGEKLQREFGVGTAHAGEMTPEIRSAIERQKTGNFDLERTMAIIRRQESYTFEGKYNAKSKTSSASGAYQFLDKTWRGVTNKYGIGTEYKTARDAPRQVQDAVMTNYLTDLYKKHGDLGTVLKVHFTGNAAGKMSAKAMAANKGMTGDQYVQNIINKHGPEYDKMMVERQQTQVAAATPSAPPIPTPTPTPTPTTAPEPSYIEKAKSALGYGTASAETKPSTPTHEAPKPQPEFPKTPKAAEPPTPPQRPIEISPVTQAREQGKPDESSQQNFLKSQGIGKVEPIPARALGGDVKAPGEIAAYPINDMGHDNTIAVDTKTEKPLFTFNPQTEIVAPNGENNRATVIPTNKIGGEIGAPQQAPNFTGALNELRQEIGSAFANIGKPAEASQQRTVSQDREVSPNFINSLLQQNTQTFQNPSMYRAMKRATAQSETDELHGHYGQGTNGL
jgi:hypothetical protein